MLTLAIDTSGDCCSVALHDLSSDRILASIERQTVSGHAEQLFAIIAEALDSAAVDYPSIGRVAAVRGPGSFTGIRIGLAAARGLALALGIPAIGIGTLAAHAETARRIAGEIGVRRPGGIIAAIDARRGEIYAQYFAAGEAQSREPTVAAPGDILASWAADLPPDTAICGAAARQLGEGFGVPVHELATPDIAVVAAMASAADPARNPPEPLYVRPPDAKPAAAALRFAARPTANAPT